MTITIDTTDTRSRKALEIAAEAGQWLKCRTRDGQKKYAVPSQSAPGVYHLADLRSCTCPDFARRGGPCKHILAIRLYCALVQVRAQQQKEVIAETEPYAF